MAVPVIDWSDWSASTIEPFMEAVIHFQSGNVTLTDENIVNVQFDALMFDSSHVLFGPPQPITGFLEIIDYNQIYNPITNAELIDNIQIDLYLGINVSGTAKKQLYGIFFAQEWAYDTSTHITTVDFIDKVDELLTVDNRLDGLVPTKNQDLQAFLVALLDLSGHTWVNHLLISNTVTLPYSFYEESMASTLNNAIEALMASYIYAPDGIGHLFKEYWYTTGITLTDEDVDSWEFMQSSIQTYDSVDVKAQLPFLKKEEVLVSFDSTALQASTTYDYTATHVFETYGFQASTANSTIPIVIYNANILGIYWRNSSNILYDTFSVIGSVIKFAEQQVSVVGNRPYTITNNYIPTISYAAQISQYLESKIFEDYFVLKCSLRGCYGLWVGGLISVDSDMYDISGTYTIVGLSFSYNGAVHTNLTLHRIS